MSKRKAFDFLPLSKIEKPASLLRNPGDEFCAKITKTGRKVATLKVDGVKRAIVQYKSGRTVETIST